MKDYYKIMNLPYDASADEIRQAYHRFAKKYHPDKNGGQAAADLFLDIQEAYYTLSDEKRRQVFHAASHYPYTSKKRTQPPVTSESILRKCQLLNDKIRGMNKYRINLVLISQTIDSILSEKNIAILQAEKKGWLMQEVVNQLVLSMNVLPYRYIVGNTNKLLRIATNNQLLQEQLIAFGNRKRKLRFWEKYNVIIILLATVLICLLIVFLSE